MMLILVGMWLFVGGRAEGGILSGAWFTPDSTTVTVLSVTPRSPAGQAGLRPGDVVYAMDGQLVGSPNLLDQELEMSLSTGHSVLLDILRAGRRNSVWVRMPKLPLSTKRFLKVYAPIRAQWDQMVSCWEGIRSSYRATRTGVYTKEEFYAHILEAGNRFQDIRNQLIETVIPWESGEAWREMGRAKELMEWTALVMEEGAQQLGKTSEEGTIRRRMDTVRKVRSDVEKHLTMAVRAMGLEQSDFFVETWPR